MRVKLLMRSISEAENRLNACKSIEETLDLGNGITNEIFESKIDALKDAVDDYNQGLAGLDGKRSNIRTLEKEVLDLREQMLLGVASKFGKDSVEYAQAGGVRKSERKRPRRPSVATKEEQTSTAS